jgi:hypothetical protein
MRPGVYTLRATRFYDLPQAAFDLANVYLHQKRLPCSILPAQKMIASPHQNFFPAKFATPKRMVKKKLSKKSDLEKKYPDRIYRGRILTLVPPAAIHSFKDRSF